MIGQDSSPNLAVEQIRLIAGRIQVDEEADSTAAAHQLAGRVAAAVAIRGRLPAFVRTAKRPELESRIRHAGLLAAAQAWTWERGNVVLSGPTDIGKTTAAGLLFRLVLGRAVRVGGVEWEKAQSLRWVAAVDIVDARRHQRLGTGEATLITEAENARLLVIDDAGWEKDPHDISDVLNVRYERQWPTVITTGRSKAELLHHYGAAVIRRMLQAGGRAPVIVDGFPVATPRAKR